MKLYVITPIIIGAVSYLCFINDLSFFNIVEHLHNLVNRQFLMQYTQNELLRDFFTKPKEKLFTKKELSKFVGKNENLYISILGHVFDVTKGKKYYGPGETYHCFTGKDASKAFITGDFTEFGLTDDISDLSLSDLSNLRDWLKRYEKDYIYRGKLIGRFYDERGRPTAYTKEIESKIQESDKLREQSTSFNLKYPPCNVEWSQDKGSRVWCSNKSGGIKRDWIGVPRKIFMPGWNDYRCACINPDSQQIIKEGQLKQYDSCDPQSESCYVGNL